MRALQANGDATLVCRSIIARDGAKQMRIVTALLLLTAGDSREIATSVELGEMTLASAVMSLDDLTDAGTLLSALQAAFPAGEGIGHLLQQQGQARSHISRSWGRDPSSGRWSKTPLWKARFQGVRDQSVYLPTGPFFDAVGHHFYPSISHAIAAWIGTPLLGEREVTADDTYHVIVPDPRAYLVDLRADDEGLAATISGTLSTGSASSEALYCAVAGTDIDGNAIERVVAVNEGVARIPSNRLMRRFTLFLLGPDGTVYDQHTEHDHRAASGESLFFRESIPPSSGVTALLAAAESGENERVEFKEWIPKDRRDKKSAELLKTAVAFANAEGGTVFIGISKEGDIVGVERSLRAEYTKTAGVDLAKLRDAYYDDIRDRLLTGVRPRLGTHLEWVPPRADTWVLSITIERGGRDAHFIDATRETFIRRGATSRRASPEDLDRMREDRARRPTLGRRLP